MKKTIRMLMTSAKATALGMHPSTTEKALAPVEVELDGERFALRDVLRGENGTPVLVWQHDGEEKRLPLKVL